MKTRSATNPGLASQREVDPQVTRLLGPLVLAQDPAPSMAKHVTVCETVPAEWPMSAESDLFDGVISHIYGAGLLLNKRRAEAESELGKDLDRVTDELDVAIRLLQTWALRCQSRR